MTYSYTKYNIRRTIRGGIKHQKARLNCIRHLLTLVPYQEIKRSSVVLPERVYHADYQRTPVPKEMIVPELY